MTTYDRTLSTDTINAIVRGLANSPDIQDPTSRDYMRAMELLAEKKRRRLKRSAGKPIRPTIKDLEKMKLQFTEA